MSKIDNEIRAELAQLEENRILLENRIGAHQTAILHELADSDEDTDRAQWAREWRRMGGRMSHLVTCTVRGIMPSPLPGCWA